MAASTTNLGSLLFSSMFLFFFPYTHTFTAYLGHFSSSFLFFQGLYSRLRLKNAQSKTKDNNKKKEEREKKSTEYNESEYRTIR
jgi:hypothetical protein